MKKVILSLSFFFAAFEIYAQCSSQDEHRCDNGNSYYPTTNSNYYYANNASYDVNAPIEVAVYPNPTSNYITFEAKSNIKMLRIYNLNGKMMKTFNVLADQTYSITDLNEGMYILQFLNSKGKVLNTQRIRKVSANN